MKIKPKLVAIFFILLFVSYFIVSTVNGKNIQKKEGVNFAASTTAFKKDITSTSSLSTTTKESEKKEEKRIKKISAPYYITAHPSKHMYYKKKKKKKYQPTLIKKTITTIKKQPLQIIQPTAPVPTIPNINKLYCDIVSDKDIVNAGDTVTFSWVSSPQAVRAELNNRFGKVKLADTLVIPNVTYTRIFRLTVFDKNNNEFTCSKNVYLSTDPGAERIRRLKKGVSAVVRNTTPTQVQEITSVKTTYTQEPTVQLPQVHAFTPSSNHEYGIWVWESPYQLAKRNHTIIDDIAAHGFKTIYITVDDILSANNIQSYYASLADFVQYAHTKDISVDAELGARDWAKKANRYKPYKIISLISAYNTQYPNARVRKIQYDIEPYLLPEYNAHKEKVLTDFVEFIDESAHKIKALGNIGFSVVIPHFYDSAQKWTPTVTFGNKKTYAFNHILNSLNILPDAHIIIMAYRNFLSTKDGSDALSQVEIQQATGNTKIIIAQETGDVSPSYVTFYNTNKSKLYTQITRLQSQFSKNTNFGGIAVHYYEPFMGL